MGGKKGFAKKYKTKIKLITQISYDNERYQSNNSECASDAHI
jgi:hypothetical protein